MNSNSTATLGEGGANVTKIQTDFCAFNGVNTGQTGVTGADWPMGSMRSDFPSVAVEFEFIIDVKDPSCVSSSSQAICA